tara:strand:- start:2496 stop:3371 length:876 start_codon:yes stop_codon:yes gene_type:complete
MIKISPNRILWGILIVLLSVPQLSAQELPYIQEMSINSKSKGFEIELINSDTLKKEDISSWIEKKNWFILNMYNIQMPSSEFFEKYTNYPIEEIIHTVEGNALQLSFHVSRAIGSFDVIHKRHENKILISLIYADFVEAKDVNPSFIFPEEKDAQRKQHPLSWKDQRARTSIRILCDTKGLPIYVDNHMVGYSPIDHPIDVLPGWHKVGYFSNDYANNPEVRTPKEKMMNDILRMGLLDIYVEEGKEETIALNYQNLDDEVIDYNKRFQAGTWIGFSIFFSMILLISWGLT